jgi:hypothetical protein
MVTCSRIICPTLCYQFQLFTADVAIRCGIRIAKYLFSDRKVAPLIRRTISSIQRTAGTSDIVYAAAHILARIDLPLRESNPAYNISYCIAEARIKKLPCKSKVCCICTVATNEITGNK